MEQKLLKDFELDRKKPSEKALQRWRSAVSIVKNTRRRFRHVADLAKPSAAEKNRRTIQYFELDHKKPSEKALHRWRSAVSIVKNTRRLFRQVADLAIPSAAEKIRRTIQDFELDHKNPSEKALKRWRSAVSAAEKNRRTIQDFELDHKNPSEKALQRWRSAVSAAEKNRRTIQVTTCLSDQSPFHSGQPSLRKDKEMTLRRVKK